MSILSTIHSAFANFRIVPPPEKPVGNDEDRPSRSSSPQIRQPTLSIMSYNRLTPPDPKPDLEYDCRITQNPSRRTRQEHTGLDDEVQEELMDRVEFNNLVSRAEDEIRKLMELKNAQASKDNDGEVVLRVGCLCGSGHHRSVAFAEQLQKIEWPSEWKVEAVHRDMTDKVRERKEDQRVTHLKERDEVIQSHRRS